MKRIDAKPLLMGRGDYFDDVKFQGSYGVIVGSPYSHARIVKVNATVAEKAGAKVLTGKTMMMEKTERTVLVQHGGEEKEAEESTREGAVMSISPLAVDKVRYQGEPVAFVIGGSQYEAADLAELVEVEYEPLEAVTSIEKGLNERASALFDEFPNNVVSAKRLDYGTMPPPASRYLDLDLFWGRSLANPIEPFGISAISTAEGVTVAANTQGSRFIATEAEKALGMPVKIVPTRQGGSFGSKFSMLKYVVIVAFAARYFRLPVKWVETRREHLLASSTSGPERRFKVRAYFKTSGEVTGIDCQVWEDVGAAKEGNQALKPTAMLAGPYKIKNLRYAVSIVATNKNPAGAFRGAGTPPHAWMIERVMDAVADELRIDRVELRRKNTIEQFPWEAPGAYYESGNPMQLLQAATAREDLFAMRSESVGVGLALATDCATPGSSAFNPGEGLKIRVEKGNVILGLGYGPEGQGNEHTAVFLTAKLLGIPVSRVSYEILDTASSVTSFGPGGSRMGVYVAGAVAGAVDELKTVLKEKAVQRLGTSHAEYRDGSFWADGRRRKVPLLDLEGRAEYVYSLHGRSTFTTYPFCCNVAVVRLSETGQIIPLKQVVYIDPGTPIDEDLVREQLEGGTATGIALALYERSVYDETGNLVSATLGDYGMPTAADLPDIEVNILPTPSPSTPMGAKGIGEIPVGVAAAAVTSAVEDVLKRRITRIPIRV